MHETLRFDGKPLSATLSREADRWFISIPVEIERLEPVCESQATVGIDLGVSTAVTLSTGEKIDSPKPLKKAPPALEAAIQTAFPQAERQRQPA
jgi:putative transposase